MPRKLCVSSGVPVPPMIVDLEIQCDILAISSIVTIRVVVGTIEGCFNPISRFKALSSTSPYLRESLT